MKNEVNRTLVQITASLEAKLGGPPRVVEDTFPYLAEKYDAHLVVFGNSEIVTPRQIINTTFLQNRFGLRFRKPTKESIAAMNQAQVVVIHGFYLYSTLISLHFSKSENLFLMPHGSMEKYQESKGRLRKRIFTQLFLFLLGNRKIRFIVASNSEKQSVLQKFPQFKTIVVGLGVEKSSQHLQKEQLPHQPVRLFCLSRISQVKRLDLSIKCLSILNKNSNKYTLDIYGVGDLKLSQNLTGLVKDLDLSETVTFHGFADLSKKNETLKRSDILLLPSENENFAIVVAESIAAGIPVILFKNVGMHEFVDEHKAGITIQSLSEVELAEAVFTVVQDFAVYRQNCVKAAEYLTWENVIQRWFVEFEGNC